MDNRSFGRLTCIAGEDLQLGDVVKFEGPTAVTPHPIAIKTNADGIVLGTVMADAADGETVDIRLFIAGTLSATTNVDAAYDPGNPTYVGAGLLSDVGAEVKKRAGIMVERTAILTGDDNARIEHLILHPTPSV